VETKEAKLIQIGTSRGIRIPARVIGALEEINNKALESFKLEADYQKGVVVLKPIFEEQ